MAMILIAGIIEGISSRKDKTIKLTIGTQELAPAEVADIFLQANQFCFFAIKPEPFVKEEQYLIESLKADYDSSKTPSQRLRGVLYRLFEKQPEGYKDFNSYYVAKMDQITDHYKSKLDAEAY